MIIVSVRMYVWKFDRKMRQRTNTCAQPETHRRRRLQRDKARVQFYHVLAYRFTSFRSFVQSVVLFILLFLFCDAIVLIHRMINIFDGTLYSLANNLIRCTQWEWMILWISTRARVSSLDLFLSLVNCHKETHRNGTCIRQSGAIKIETYIIFIFLCQAHKRRKTIAHVYCRRIQDGKEWRGKQ